MKTTEFIRKFKSSYLWANLAAMAFVVAALVVGIGVGVDIYTHHGEEITIPDVRRHSLPDATHVLEGLGFVVVVADTGYVRSLPPGSVLEQQPAPGLVVKSGRYIYLTINADKVPTLTLPDIIDNSSYREAKVKLTSMGFKLGEPQYISGEKDWVYGVKCRGRELMAGAKVSIEDVLILLVGNGMREGGDSVYVTTDPEYDFPEIGDIESDEDDFEIVTDE